MPLNTAFEYIRTTQLPLPRPKEHQTFNDVADRGIQVALDLLHDPNIMIQHDSPHLLMIPIDAKNEAAVEVAELAADFNVPLNPSLDLMGAESGWNHFEITETIPVIFGMSKEITFHTALRYNSDGMEALTDAGSSVVIHGKYVVSKTEDDERCLTLSEVTNTHCSAFLGWYIKATMGKSHDNVHAHFKEKFVEHMSV